MFHFYKLPPSRNASTQTNKLFEEEHASLDSICPLSLLLTFHHDKITQRSEKHILIQAPSWEPVQTPNQVLAATLTLFQPKLTLFWLILTTPDPC